MKSKILYYVVGGIVIVTFIIAGIVIGKKYNKDESFYIKYVNELKLVDGYDYKDTTILDKSEKYEIVNNVTKEGMSVIDNLNNIVEKYEDKFYRFVSNLNGTKSDYYYYLENTTVHIKLNGKEKYSFDVRDYYDSDFNVVNIYEPVEDKIFMIIYSNDSYKYVLYDKEKMEFKDFESSTLLTMVNTNDENYYVMYDNYIYDVTTLEKVSEKYTSAVLFGLGNNSVYTYSKNYVVIHDVDNFYIVDLENNGSKVTKNNYDPIVSVSPNNKYFIEYVNQKYNMYNMSENIVLKNYDYIQFTDNSIVTINNNTLVVRDLNNNEIKRINYKATNYTVAYESVDNNLLFTEYDINNIEKGIALYNMKSKIAIEGDVKSVYLKDDFIGVLKGKNSLDILYDNLRKKITIDNEQLIKTNAIYLLNSEDKKMCLTSIDENQKSYYYTLNLKKEEIHEVGYYDCMKLNEKDEVIYKTDKIVLKDGNNVVNAKIDSISRVGEKYFNVTYNDNTWLYEYVK